MKTSSKTCALAALAASALLAGCAQTGPMLPTRTALGSLKTSVSHLEYENDQLRKKLAQVEADKRDVDDRLAQEEWTNGDLSRRLDDARHELGQRGYDLDSSRTSRRRSDDEPGTSPRTLPAGRPRKRKTPFAQIPGQIQAAPPSDASDDETFVNPKSPANDDLGPQGALDSQTWLPVARAPASNAKQVR